MLEKAMYFGKSKLYQKIKDIGGKWNDTKERPLVCLIKSTEHENLFWAIPVGNWNHRDKTGQERIEKFMSYPENDIRSCYYHIGKTNIKSIFFISDVIPITEEYIDRGYKVFDEDIYIIKNPKLIQSLIKKLRRILAFESSNNNYFRQRITDIKNVLISELELQQTQEQVAPTKIT